MCMEFELDAFHGVHGVPSVQYTNTNSGIHHIKMLNDQSPTLRSTQRNVSCQIKPVDNGQHSSADGL